MSEKTKATLLLIVSVLYVLSPIDFLPDAIPVLGNGDDLISMYIALNRHIRAHLSA